jgi:AcrR family transcriptional regulator
VTARAPRGAPRDTGVTPAAVYAYFPDEEGLFAAALDRDAADPDQAGCLFGP